jgi:hypothetical protein
MCRTFWKAGKKQKSRHFDAAETPLYSELDEPKVHYCVEHIQLDKFK